MAKFVTVKGEILDVKPDNKKVFTLKELQSYVGGYIQMLRLPSGETLICNEDGMNLELATNTLATFLVQKSYNGQRTQQFVGDVLFVENCEIK
jgi:hypothetical protein